MNFLPIVVRELRITARKPATYWRRSVVALLFLSLFLFTAWGNSLASSSQMGRNTFDMLSGLALGGCLLAGVFQTADCISSEKREGTIGFLFLTDLHGYDVLIGKLVSNSLYSIYALLGILPVMALPLLVGGVSFGEFWRTVVILLDALFFSLAIGIFVSTISRESRQAFSGTLLIVLLTTGFLPGLGAALRTMLPPGTMPEQPFLWPSLGYAVRESGDAYYHYGTGPQEFWGCIGTVFAFGALGLMIASVLLPRVWQEKAHSRSTGRGSLWQRVRFGSIACRNRLRLRLLPRNPFCWLAVRDRAPRILVRLLMLVAIPLWLWAYFQIWISPSMVSAQVPFLVLIFTTFGFSLLFKTAVAIESTRRFHDDRGNGALELLLVTPLSVRKILSGQRRALWRHYWGTLIMLFLMFAAVWWFVTHPMPWKFSDPEMGVMMGGNCLTLVVDFWAIGWLGMWAGLRAKRHDRAVVSVLSRLLVVPWMFYMIMGMSGVAMRGSNQMKTFLVFWFLFGVALDIFWAVWAWLNLRLRFRAAAAGLTARRRRRVLLQARLQPAPA